MNESRNKILVLALLGVIVVLSIVIFSQRILSGGEKVDLSEKDFENVSDDTVSEEDPPIISSNDLRDLIESDKNVTIINPESAENFYKKRIPNSISFPSDQASARINELPKDSILIVTSSGSESGCNLSRSIAQLLIDQGFPYVRDHHDGWIGWEKAGYPVVEANEVRVPQLSISDLEKNIENNEEMTLIDIRSKSEYDVAHIQGAINIPFFEYANRKDEIPRNAQIILYGDTDTKSQQLAIELINNRYIRVKMLVGGFSAWNVQGKPTISSN